MTEARPLGLVVNPLSGRDVRRLLGRAGHDTPDAKRNQLERAAIGAAMAGVERILWTPDVFRISERLHGVVVARLATLCRAHGKLLARSCSLE